MSYRESYRDIDIERMRGERGKERQRKKQRERERGGGERGK